MKRCQHLGPIKRRENGYHVLKCGIFGECTGLMCRDCGQFVDSGVEIHGLLIESAAKPADLVAASAVSTTKAKTTKVCQHRSPEPVRHEECRPCNGRTSLPVFHCTLHGCDCAESKVTGMKIDRICKICPDGPWSD